MLEFICLFCTSFISLAIYLKFFSKKTDILFSICYYFISVLANTFIMNGIFYFSFGKNDLVYTLSFTDKYILLSSFIATLLPIIFNLLEILIHKFLKLAQPIFKKKLLKVNKYLKKNKEQVKNNSFFMLFVILQFWFFDIVIRVITYKETSFYNVFMPTPNLLTIAYGAVVAVILILLPKKAIKIFFPIIYVFNLILFITNYMLLAIKSEAFTMHDLQIASEGFEYSNFILREINFGFIVLILISIVLFILAFKQINKVKYSLNKKISVLSVLIGSIVIFILVRFLSVGIMRDYKTDIDWEGITFPKFYTENFINSRNSISVLGLYEYTYRDAKYYIANSKTIFGSKEEIDEAISKSNIETEKNDKTALFKDKNLIMIMMESLDNVMVDEETMPTLTKIMNEGWNFKKRYSQLNSGGSTIATEYTTLSGLFYLQDERFDSNTYNESIPNLFNKNNYNVASFHENKGIYYNRTQLHKSLGFPTSYFLMDMHLDGYKIFDDAQFFDNDELYNLVVPKDKGKNFMSFIVTITSHGPYVNNSLCSDQGDLSEKECFQYLSSQTDKMLKSMLKRLKEDNLLDDTVIVLYSDHAAYTYNYTEEDLEATYEKIDDAYSIKNIPFVIYNPNLEAKEYSDIIVNDVDFAPTIFNLFGIDYDAKYYVGTDIFSKAHKNICMFNDYRWYDGKIYNSNATQDDYYKTTSKYVKDRIDLSKMIVNNNYYKTLKTK